MLLGAGSAEQSYNVFITVGVSTMLMAVTGLAQAATD